MARVKEKLKFKIQIGPLLEIFKIQIGPLLEIRWRKNIACECDQIGRFLKVPSVTKEAQIFWACLYYFEIITLLLKMLWNLFGQLFGKIGLLLVYHLATTIPDLLKGTNRQNNYQLRFNLTVAVCDALEWLTVGIFH